MSQRRNRIAVASVAAAVVAATVLAAVPSASGDLGSPGLDDSDPLFLPLRWCAVQGSPAVTNPAGVGEPDTDSVLWRRHERATDYIWFPGALISFRSAFTAGVVTSGSYPVIADPAPGGPGQPGDIDISPNSSELSNALASCRLAWDAIEVNQSRSFEGPIALNLRQFVNANGTPSSLFGTSNFQVEWLGTAGLCDSTIVANDGDAAFVAVRDNSFGLASDPHDRLLAHEAGHVFFLGHGNGIDDDGDGPFDGCDGAFYPTSPPNEDPLAAPASLMTTPIQSEIVTTRQRGTVAPMTPARQAGARGVAKVTSGVQYDPAGTYVNVRVTSDHRADRAHDAPAGIDVVSAGYARNDDLRRIVLTHTMFGTVPKRGAVEYDLFLDLDGDVATGGSPSALGFPTPRSGIELVSSVRVSGGRVAPSATRIWRFRAGAFRTLPRRLVHATILRSFESETRRPLFDSVSVQLPAKHVGPTAQRIDVQAIARSLGPGPRAIDRLPDRTRALRPLFLAPLRYPEAVVTPARVRPGQTVAVVARGLMPNGTAKLYLGDRWVARAPIGDGGGVATTFVVPPDARGGPRLVTVGAMGTALSADALLEVDAPRDAADAPPPAYGGD